MIVIVVGYVAILVLWLTIFFVHPPHRATWWLLLASVVVGVAWFMQSIWLSFFGMLAALTSVSYIFQVLTDWLRKRHVNRVNLIVWLEWLLVFSVTVAHMLVLMLNYIHEAAN
ncbi:MAG: hypothetical protein WCV88_05070 [Patescibacteria group bacterium]